MGGIAPVVPVEEAGVVGLKGGHEGEPAVRTQQLVQPQELVVRPMEMLGHFGAGDEIVGAFERRGIGVEKGIVKVDGMARLLEHFREGGTGATTVVEAGLAWRQAG